MTTFRYPSDILITSRLFYSLMEHVTWKSPISADEYIVATEQACKFLPEEESHQLRAKVAGLLHSAKPPQSNMSKGERQALGNLAKNKDIAILPADKGKATVIMDTEDYELKVKEMLDDKRTY